MIFFKNISLLPFIWVIVALIPLLIGEYYLRRRQHSRFTDITEKSRLGRDQGKRIFFTTLAGIFLFTAILRPSWNPSVQIVEQEGRDVVFLLDVSRSMTADDVAPNRLERAKLEIFETIHNIDGDRVSLVAFAGNSVVKCPLTLDYGFFEMVLDDISVNSVTRGGSQLGDALRMVESQVFDDQVREQRDIILITDGEDQESFPVEAAKALGQDGVRLIIIGLGDSLQGARIKDEEGNYLTHEGQEVWSKMDGETLRQMAAATPGGRYLEAGQANFSLPQIYRSLISQGAEKSTGEEETLVYEEKFQFFLALALIFLLLEAFRIIGPVNLKKHLTLFRSGKMTSPILFLLFLPLFSGMGVNSLQAEGRADLFNQGEKALVSQNWEGFDQIYQRLTDRGANEGKIAYNRGRSLFDQEDYKGAADSFGEASARLEGKQAAQSLYNRGNSLLKQAESDSENSQNLTKQAAESYQKALELDPKFKEAARNLEILNSQEEPPPQDSDGDDQSDEKGDQNQDSQGDPQDNSSGDQQNQDQQSEQDQNSQEPQESQESQDESDQQAQDLLNQEEEDREERESTLQQAGGIYQVERDW